MSRIGILGGTFNPIHNAHLIMAQEAYRQGELDTIWFMPSRHPPHKSYREIVPEHHRKQMIQLAIKNTPEFVFSDYELLRQGTTYTADTLEALSRQRPEDSLYFIIGGDSFFYLDQWYHPERVMKYATLLVFSRDGAKQDVMEKRARQLKQRYNAKIHLLQMVPYSISSREIRQKIQNQQSIQGMVPVEVEEYMRKHHLYTRKAVEEP